MVATLDHLFDPQISKYALSHTWEATDIWPEIEANHLFNNPHSVGSRFVGVIVTYLWVRPTLIVTVRDQGGKLVDIAYAQQDRITPKNEVVYDCGVFIKPEHRGQNLARRALRHLVARLQYANPDRKIRMFTAMLPGRIIREFNQFGVYVISTL